jgi:hypothetical protein
VCLTVLTGVEPLSESCSASPAGTGLTGSAHRPDRCGSVDSRFGFPLCFSGSEGCVLVPRSSGTPVATWALPTWVVSRRRVLEAVFILLEFPSPSRRIFYRLPFTPPLSGSPYRSFKWYQSRFVSLLTLTSLRSKDGVPGTRFGSSTLQWQKLPGVEQADGCVSPRKGSDSLGCHGGHRLCPADGLPRSRIEGKIRRQQ